MNAGPNARIIPLRQRMCGVCLVALIVGPWLLIALAVWAWRTFG